MMVQFNCGPAGALGGRYQGSTETARGTAGITKHAMPSQFRCRDTENQQSESVLFTAETKNALMQAFFLLTTALRVVKFTSSAVIFFSICLVNHLTAYARKMKQQFYPFIEHD